MPELHDSFILDRLIDEKQMSVLEKGNIPQEMEDKCFWYGGSLYMPIAVGPVFVYI